jgi:hypothetical protein
MLSKDVKASEASGMRGAADLEHWDLMETIVGEHNHSVRHLLQLWPTYVRRQNLTRFLAHYELFKQVIDLPGHIVEVGVFRGASFFTWAKLLETFNPTDRRRKVFGFDHFRGLQDFDAKDGAPDPRDGKVVGGYDASQVKKEIEDLVALHNRDNLISGVERCRLIEGDVTTMLPRFIEENPGLRIALLHLDVDLYLPTKAALEHLYPLVVKGGLVVLDEYGLMPWEGESRAAEEYFASIGEQPVFRKFPFSTQPHGYFVK